MEMTKREGDAPSFDVNCKKLATDEHGQDGRMDEVDEVDWMDGVDEVDGGKIWKPHERECPPILWGPSVRVGNL